MNMLGNHDRCNHHCLCSCRSLAFTGEVVLSDGTPAIIVHQFVTCHPSLASLCTHCLQVRQTAHGAVQRARAGSVCSGASCAASHATRVTSGILVLIPLPWKYESACKHHEHNEHSAGLHASQRFPFQTGVLDAFIRGTVLLLVAGANKWLICSLQHSTVIMTLSMPVDVWLASGSAQTCIWCIICVACSQRCNSSATFKQDDTIDGINLLQNSIKRCRSPSVASSSALQPPRCTPQTPLASHSPPAPSHPTPRAKQPASCTRASLTPNRHTSHVTRHASRVTRHYLPQPAPHVIRRLITLRPRPPPPCWRLIAPQRQPPLVHRRALEMKHESARADAPRAPPLIHHAAQRALLPEDHVRGIEEHAGGVGEAQGAAV